jgi:hypothetical protein
MLDINQQKGWPQSIAASLKKWRIYYEKTMQAKKVFFMPFDSFHSWPTRDW